jgi:hypothetical protein
VLLTVHVRAKPETHGIIKKIFNQTTFPFKVRAPCFSLIVIDYMPLHNKIKVRTEFEKGFRNKKIINQLSPSPIDIMMDILSCQ